MSKHNPSSFRLPEEATIDLSPSAVLRYRALAEMERNKAVAQFFRRVFGRRPGSATATRHAPVPAE